MKKSQIVYPKFNQLFHIPRSNPPKIYTKIHPEFANRHGISSQLLVCWY